MMLAKLASTRPVPPEGSAASMPARTRSKSVVRSEPSVTTWLNVMSAACSSFFNASRSARPAPRRCSSRCTRDAVAHVERQDDVERDLLEAGVIDLLRHAVVEQLEVSGLEAEHRAAVVRDQHVDAHRFGFRSEGRPLSFDRAAARSE